MHTERKPAGMKGPIGFFYIVLLLALCCLLIPNEGESAGVTLSNGGNKSSDETLDPPEREQGLAGDQTGNGKRYAKELLQRGE